MIQQRRFQARIAKIFFAAVFVGFCCTVVVLGINYDDTILGTIPAEINSWDRAETFIDKEVVDDFIDSDSAALIPLPADDEGKFAAGLTNDDTGLIRPRN